MEGSEGQMNDRQIAQSDHTHGIVWNAENDRM